MSEPISTMERAIQAAQSGQRALARKLFLRVLEQNPNQREAWEQLSAVLDDPEDQLRALENALALCPPGTAAYLRLAERLYSQRRSQPEAVESETATAHEKLEALIREALQLSAAGKTQEATALLEEIARANPQDERAWLIYSEIHPQVDEKVRALAKVVAINPRNEEGWRRLELLRQVEKEPLKRGRFLEERGDFEQAVEIYRSVIVHSRSALERVEAERRIERIQLHREAHRLQPVHPNLNIARLAIGPVLLFVVMVFMQSGLNVLRTPLAALLGFLSVAAGSLFVAVIGIYPAPPLWVKIIGEPGTGEEPEIRAGLRVLGWALMLAPFAIFLIEATYRLGILQSALLANMP